ncbi:hypothetical protein [Salinactinospora qingdaonensis]|uniref:Integral membrane protein n=1 Tax=Salinactinospora qingdaonensis TaxID=702744 RepID=A0ABP7GJ04_9ACTN
MFWTLLYTAAALASVGSIVAGRPWVSRLARRSAPDWVRADPVFGWMATTLTWLWAGLFALAALLSALVEVTGVGVAIGVVLSLAGWQSPLPFRAVPQWDSRPLVPV